MFKCIYGKATNTFKNISHTDAVKVNAKCHSDTKMHELTERSGNGDGSVCVILSAYMTGSYSKNNDEFPRETGGVIVEKENESCAFQKRS